MNNRTQFRHNEGETEIKECQPIILGQKSKSEDSPMESLRNKIGLQKMDLVNLGSHIDSEIQSPLTKNLE